VNEQLIPFGPGAQVFIVFYLLSLLAIGALAYRARTEHSLQDFYLAGRGIGLITLLLTLYSTQYSGNTLLGFSGKTYRIGLSWGMCIHFMTAIVVVYLFFAPQLHRLAKRHDFITPVDFLTYRFQDQRLSLIASVVMVVAIANFLLAQLMAMGNALQGLTSADPATAYTVGVVVLALIIVVYETLGGFRAVAWTDVIQGSVLLLGFVLLLLAVPAPVKIPTKLSRRIRIVCWRNVICLRLRIAVRFVRHCLSSEPLMKVSGFTWKTAK